ncbi:MAG: ATP-binding protein, partial [Bacteroidota bacterium]
SHEFRTPLTLILGPTEQLLGSARTNAEKQQLGWIYKSARSLLRLINQLLDLSKIEARQLELKVSEQDLVQFCKFIVSAFESLAAQKKLKLEFEAPDEPIVLFFDPEKLEHILNNLLFNAFKFTPQGTVKLQLSRTETEGIITVADSGIGIPPEQMPYIFDRFYQAQQKEETIFEGTGIGLALCKELVELHHGDIEVKSQLKKGTQFRIALPFGKSHFQPNEITERSDYFNASNFKVEMEVPIETVPNEQTEDEQLPLLLLVDDNRDILDYVQSQLSGRYRFIKAANGREGLQQAKKHIPDLIISDVMMPEMNGFEFCESIKKDINTDHIPVILLTARLGEDSKLKGLETKADEYLQKPFNSRELELRVRNLIEGRRKLRKRFAERVIFQPAAVAETPTEERFLQQLLDTIEAELSNPQFDVSTLSQKMAMSKSQLNRKMKAVLNKSPNQFIRSYRLAKAKELIQNTHLSLTEIAYDTGFSSLAYFSKCFSDEFGHAPSEIDK